tara:strand:- start:216 stop:968 length:753 start_codon:yes stop_codon:yes gene_type:complete
MKEEIIIPNIQPDGYISAEDYGHMRSLGMDDPEEYERLKNLSVDELMEERVADVEPSDSELTVLVIDNFYNNPDAVREYAMTRDFVERGYHGAVGHRTLTPKHFKGVKEKFESILGKKMAKGKELGGWEYSTNGVFQHCMAEDPFVIHADDQKWAAMIYLTPDAPVECGTTLYRHKKTGQDRVEKKSDWNVFKNNYYDPTPFEVVDVIGNKYNRMILFDARHIHAASQYFGDSIENDRLFQLYFFNTEDR